MKILLGVLGLLLLVSLDATAQHAEKDKPQKQQGAKPASPVAKVLKVKGKVYRLETPQSFLTEKVQVYSGWKLMCKPGCELVLRFDKIDVPIRPSEKPYIVPFLSAGSGLEDAVLKPAGRTQSDAGSLFSPPHPPQDKGRVWPAQFVIRWTPLPKGTRLNLILRRYPVRLGDDALWGKAVVEDGTGAYDSEEVRDVLTRFRTSNPREQLELTLAPEDGTGTKVVFSLLSEAEEKRLNADLKAWEEEPTLLRNVVRASLFQRYRLYTEAAEEMEAALEVSSDSVALRIAAIWAHRRSGNLAREEYQTKLLPPGTVIPDH